MLTLQDLALDSPGADAGAPVPANESEGDLPPLKAAVRAYELQLIRKALSLEKTKRGAARRLGISHTALINRLRQNPDEV